MTRTRVCAVGVAVALAAGLTVGCGDQSPSTNDWPRYPGSALLLSLETRSEVDTASDKTQYRTLLMGLRKVSTATLERRSIRYAQSRGWRIERVYVEHSPARPVDRIVVMTSPDSKLRATVSLPLSLIYRKVNEAARRAQSAGQAALEIELWKRKENDNPRRQ